MEYDFDRNEFFMDGVESSLIKAFKIESRDIYREEKFLRDNTIEEADSFICNRLKEASQKLIDKIDKEMDPEKIKLNLSPKTSGLKVDPNTAQLLNEIFITVLSEEKKSNFDQLRKVIKEGLGSLNFALGVSYSNLTESKFLSDFIYQIPGIAKEENKVIIEIIEETLFEFELEDHVVELRSIIKNKSKLYPFSFFKQMNAESRTNINLLSNKRKSSVDKLDISPQKDAAKNFKLEKYFKPVQKEENQKTNKTNLDVGKKYSFKSSIFDAKLNLSNKFDQYAHLESYNLPSDVSYATFAEKSKSTPGELSLSKQSSVLNFTNSNSVPFSVHENSRTMLETNYKRPFKTFTPTFNTAAKSTNSVNYSISDFSNDGLTFSTLKNASSEFDLNSQKSIISRKGINSLLATRVKEVSRKKTPQVKISSSKKKKVKEGLFDKYCSKTKTDSSNKKKHRNENFNNINLPKDDQKLKFKKIIKKEFYQSMQYIDKSPDVTELKATEVVETAIATRRQPVTTTRSRSVSITDDEVLVYQTPVKVGVVKKGIMSPSPVTTRKNLFNLFNQSKL